MASSAIATMVTAKPCRDLADYWTSLRQPGHLPRRSQVDPGAIRSLLPFLYIIEVRDTGVFIRLAGTALRQLYGIEMTGRNMLDLVAPEHRPARHWRTLRAAGHPCGTCYVRRHRYPSGAVDDVESLFLPLTLDDAPDTLRARQFIGIAASLSGRRWIAEEAGRTLLTPHAFHFVDAGFGIPPTIDPPEEWTLPA